MAPATQSSRAPTRTVIPATGVVLIGSEAGVRLLAAQVGTLGTPCVPAGCITLNANPQARVADTDGLTPSHPPSHPPSLPPALGTIDELVSLHARHRFRLALVCLAGVDHLAADQMRHMLSRLSLPARFVPSLAEMLSAESGGMPGGGPPPSTTTAPIRPAQIDLSTLIGRSHYGLDPAQVSRILTNKRVLITGAGGSIGSELARVVAGFSPEAVILVERAENNLFQIDHHLSRHFPSVVRRAVLHDVVDADQTLRMLVQHRPHVVFHAAAHKHVPLMEDHPGHAVTNNLFGTKSIADASLAAGVERFVMISSDKAVNPTSVMGATKRLAEIYVASLARSQPSTRFSMVRFGNVLGSAGSVLTIWNQQLEDGHPISVTDPRMTRYFMTIPEAAALVVQAGALEQVAGQSPVYVLDMGQPVRIMDLAIRFIRLHGAEPLIDLATLPANARDYTPTIGPPPAGAATLPLVFTGSRPGEKLFEELAYSAESLLPTAHPGIHQWGSEATGLDTAAVMRMIADMSALRGGQAERGAVLLALKSWVPEMVRAED